MRHSMPAGAARGLARTRRIGLLGTALLALGLALVRPAHSQVGVPFRGYLIQDLGTLGGTNSHARTINNLGDVTGASDTASNQTVLAFRWTLGSMIDLGTLGGEESFAMGPNGANDLGEVVGDSDTEMVDAGGFEVERGFHWRAGVRTALPPATGFNVSHAHAVNSRGLVAGHSDSERIYGSTGYGAGDPPAVVINPAAAGTPSAPAGSAVQHGVAYLRQPAGSYVTVDLHPTFLPFRHSIVFGINDLDQLVGTAYNIGSVPPGPQTPVGLSITEAVPLMWQRTGSGGFALTVLPLPPLPPGAVAAAATTSDINNRGEVAGFAIFVFLVQTPTGPVPVPVQQAIVWERTRTGGFAPSILPTLPGYPLSQGICINDRGQIVGYSFASDPSTPASVEPPGWFSHATLWEKRGTSWVAIDLGTLGGTNSLALSINNRGQIAGSAQLPGDTATHAVRWNPASLGGF